VFEVLLTPSAIIKGEQYLEHLLDLQTFVVELPKDGKLLPKHVAVGT